MNTCFISFGFKVLTTLSFLATGSYQKVIGSDWNSCNSQKAVSRHINEIVSVLNNIMGEYIQFPGTRGERNSIKQGYVLVQNIYL